MDSGSMSGTDMEPAVSEAKERSDTHTHQAGGGPAAALRARPKGVRRAAGGEAQTLPS